MLFLPADTPVITMAPVTTIAMIERALLPSIEVPVPMDHWS